MACFQFIRNILCVHLSLAELGEKLAEDLQVSIRDVQVPLQLLRLHKKKIFKTILKNKHSYPFDKKIYITINCCPIFYFQNNYNISSKRLFLLILLLKKDNYAFILLGTSRKTM